MFNVRPSPQSGTSRKKFVCTKEVYEISQTDFLFMDLLNFFLSSTLIDQAIFYILGEKQLH